MPRGETLDVHLIDDGLVPGHARWPIPSPAERRIDGDGARHVGSAVAIVWNQVLSRIADSVTEQRIMPLERPRDRLGVGVEEKLGRVEAMPVLRLEGSLHA